MNYETPASAAAITTSATPTRYTLTNSYHKYVDVFVNVAFGVTTKALKVSLRGSFDDGVTWFTICCQDLTSATLAFTQELTLAADAAKGTLRSLCTAPMMQVSLDNSGSTNPCTVTISVAGE